MHARRKISWKNFEKGLLLRVGPANGEDPEARQGPDGEPTGGNREDRDHQADVETVPCHLG